jgi:hypothetical protein
MRRASAVEMWSGIATALPTTPARGNRLGPALVAAARAASLAPAARRL